MKRLVLLALATVLTLWLLVIDRVPATAVQPLTLEDLTAAQPFGEPEPFQCPGGGMLRRDVRLPSGQWASIWTSATPPHRAIVIRWTEDEDIQDATIIEGQVIREVLTEEALQQKYPRPCDAVGLRQTKI